MSGCVSADTSLLSASSSMSISVVEDPPSSPHPPTARSRVRASQGARVRVMSSSGCRSLSDYAFDGAEKRPESADLRDVPGDVIDLQEDPAVEGGVGPIVLLLFTGASPG